MILLDCLNVRVISGKERWTYCLAKEANGRHTREKIEKDKEIIVIQGTYRGLVHGRGARQPLAEPYSRRYPPHPLLLYGS